MAIVGVQPGSFSSFKWTGWNSENQVAGDLVAMPETGDITSISCYFAGHLDSPTGQLCIWDAVGSLLASTATITAAAGTGLTGGQAWQTASLASALRVTGGTQIRIGWYRCPGTAAGTCDTEWSYTAAANHYTVTNTGASPSAFTSPTTYAGQVGAYATYTPVAQQIYVDGIQLVDWIVDGTKVDVYLDNVKL